MAKRLRADAWDLLSARTLATSALAFTALTGCGGDAATPTDVEESTAAQLLPSAPVEVAESGGVPGQYIVMFADSVSNPPGLAKKLAGQYGAAPIHVYSSAFKGFAAQLPSQALEGLSHNPHVKLIEQDQTTTAASTQAGAPYGLDRIDQRSQPLDGAYNYTGTGSGVTVYIMDTGIRSTHVDFNGRVSGGYTVVSDGKGTSDCAGHGTHVAGIAGATTYGVAKSVSIVPVRVFDCTGSGSYSAIASAIDWVTKNAVRPAVVNMSFSGPHSSTLATAIQNSLNSGIVYVAAAGNSATDACNVSPGNVAGVINVGASSLDDYQTSYSNYGPCVSIFAPGTTILSALNTSDTANGISNGTSMAAPHVAGAAALYLQSHASALPAEVKQAILGTATNGILKSISGGSPNLLLYTPALSGTDTTTSVVTTPPPPATTVTASLSVSCAKSRCTADASGSQSGSTIVGYSFDFGDGTVQNSSSGILQHIYSAKGTYTLRVTISSASGTSASARATAAVRKV